MVSTHNVPGTVIPDGFRPAHTVQGVIFDFDGTLVDSMGVWERIDLAFFGKYGLPLTRENAERITTLGFAAGARFVREELGLTSLTEQEIMDEWNDMAVPHYEHEVAFKPGARELVRWLESQGVPCSICTSNERRIVRATLRHWHADGLFPQMTCANELGRAKADPRTFADAARQLGCEPARTVVFEDTAPCAAAAKKAGFWVVGVQDDNVQQDTEGLHAVADFFIDDFRQLAPGTDLGWQVFGLGSNPYEALSRTHRAAQLPHSVDTAKR